MFKNIPDDFKLLPNWVLWRNEIRDNKPTKNLYNPHNCKQASISDLQTWSTFDQCLASLPTSGMEGIGFVITPEAGLTCIDLDDPYEVDANGIPKHDNPKELQAKQMAIAKHVIIGNLGM